MASWITTDSPCLFSCPVWPGCPGCPLEFSQCRWDSCGIYQRVACWQDGPLHRVCRMETHKQDKEKKKKVERGTRWQQNNTVHLNSSVKSTALQMFTKLSTSPCPESPSSVIRSEEAFWMKGETSSRSKNRSSCIQLRSIYSNHDLDEWVSSQTYLQHGTTAPVALRVKDKDWIPSAPF